MTRSCISTLTAMEMPSAERPLPAHLWTMCGKGWLTARSDPTIGSADSKQTGKMGWTAGKRKQQTSK